MRHPFTPLSTALAGGALLLTALFPSLPSANAAGSGASVYAPVKAALQEVLIPVALPTALPLAGMPRGTHLYAEIDGNSLSVTTYIVDLGYAKGCGGAGACRYGEATGGWTGDTPGVLTPDQGGVAITLRGGVHGTYYPYTCGASCGDSIIMWHWHRIPYTVSLKGGSRADTLLMANSALVNTRSS
ncbi:MAG: hypothetical protein ACRDGS_00140 [Chloroflexota bacterium]